MYVQSFWCGAHLHKLFSLFGELCIFCISQSASLKDWTSVSVDSKCLRTAVQFVAQGAQQRITVGKNTSGEGWGELWVWSRKAMRDLNNSASGISRWNFKYCKWINSNWTSQGFFFFCLNVSSRICPIANICSRKPHEYRLNGSNVYDCSLLQTKSVQIRVTQNSNA